MVVVDTKANIYTEKLQLNTLKVIELDQCSVVQYDSH